MPQTSNLTHCTELPLLVGFAAVYSPIHAYLALTVCVFGSATNFLNAIVLVQKSMRSPTNALLTGIALVDSVTMIAYGVQIVYFNMLTSPDPNEYPHAPFTVNLLLIQNVLSISSHTISTVLLVELAAFRCWILYTATASCSVSGGANRPSAGCVSRATQRRVITGGVIVACLAGILMSLPPFFIYTVAPTNVTQAQEHSRPTEGVVELNETQSMFNVSLSSPTRKQSYWFEVRPGAASLEKVHFAVYGCFVKILASILICVLTSFILIAMEIARRRYLRLQNLSARLTPTTSAGGRCFADGRTDIVSQKILPTEYGPYEEQESEEEQTNGPAKRLASASGTANAGTNGEVSATGDRLGKKTRQSQRATIMLIVVVVSFVITEAPQGVFNTLVAVNGECFHSTVYVPLGDVLDLAVLINSSINFILYCTMSQMFRANFTRLICRMCCSRRCVRLSCCSFRGNRDAPNTLVPVSIKNRAMRHDSYDRKPISYRPIPSGPRSNLGQRNITNGHQANKPVNITHLDEER